MTVHSAVRSVAREQHSFDDRLHTRQAVIAVVGLGYVGLPLATAYTQAGFHVVGVDADPTRVNAVNAGTSPIEGVPSADVASAVEAGRLRASVQYDGLRQADVVFICVPTPCTANKEPDTSYIRAAAEGVVAHLRDGSLVILRSTSYPGTTDELVRPLLERGGRRVNRDVFLAFAPERTDPGRRQPMRSTPVLVGGCDPESTRRAVRVLGAVVDRVVPMSSPAAAEMAKLLENVFRNVNIALVNQLAMLCDRMGLNIWEIVDAAATKPYGFMSFTPGPGVGGHCIPVDPYYLAWKAREFDFHMDFVELAARVNDAMPYFVVNKILRMLNGHAAWRRPSRVLVLGVAFKRDVGDARYSPALKILELLDRQGAAVSYHDPYVPAVTLGGRTMRSLNLSAEALRRYDCVVIATDHSTVDYAWVVRHARRVFDARNATAQVTGYREKIERL